MNVKKNVTTDEALEILSARGISLDRTWLRKKCAAGAIQGAVKVGGVVWLIPRAWAESYVKDTRGRRRASETKAE